MNSSQSTPNEEKLHSQMGRSFDIQRARTVHAWTFLVVFGLALASMVLICLAWKQFLDVPLTRTVIQFPVLILLAVLALYQLKQELAERGNLLLTWPDTRPAVRARVWFALVLAVVALLQANLVFVALFTWGALEATRMNHRSQQPVRVFDRGISRHGVFVPWSTIERCSWATDEDEQILFLYQVKRRLPLFHVGALPVPEDVRDELKQQLSKYLEV